MRDDDTVLWTTQDVARASDGEFCAATVRSWARTGKLPATRTASGMRLYRPKDAERVIAARRQARAGRARG